MQASQGKQKWEWGICLQKIKAPFVFSFNVFIEQLICAKYCTVCIHTYIVYKPRENHNKANVDTHTSGVEIKHTHTHTRDCDTRRKYKPLGKINQQFKVQDMKSWYSPS